MLYNFCLVNRLTSPWKIILVKIIYASHPNKSLGHQGTHHCSNPVIESLSHLIYLTQSSVFTCLVGFLPVMFSWKFLNFFSVSFQQLLFPLDFVCYAISRLTLSLFHCLHSLVSQMILFGTAGFQMKIYMLMFTVKNCISRPTIYLDQSLSLQKIRVSIVWFTQLCY